MRLCFLVAAVAGLLFVGQAQAQTYEPGLLVRANGDTLRGELENGFWVEPPTFIHFRATPASAAQLFRPRQLRFVSFTDGRYYSYQGLPIDHAADTRLEVLTHGYATNVKTDSLLAEVLVEGPATLFRVVRPGSMHFLCRRTGQPVLDVCERQYLRQSATGAWTMVDGNNYRSQLALYFGDCRPAVQATETAAFTAEGLAAVVQAYNAACSPAAQAGRTWLAVAKPRRRVSWQGGLLAGGRYNQLLNIPNAPASGCTDCATRPFAGLYAEMMLPSRRVAIYGELSLGNFRNQGTSISEVITSNYTRPSGEPYSVTTFIYGRYAYHALMSTARIGVRYFFPLPHEQQLIFGASYETNSLWNVVVTPQPGPVPRINEVDLIYQTVPLLPSLTLGWRWHRLSLAADAHSWFTGELFALRGSISYRLSRNHDVVRKK